MNDIPENQKEQIELFKKKVDFTKKKLERKEQKKKKKKKFTIISTKTVSDRNLRGKLDSTTENIDQVLNLTEIRLDGMNIKVIENLDLYSKLTHLFLQRNVIEEISDDFEFLPSLQVLDLSNNMISKVQGLRIVENLRYLDLSSNNISEIEVEELPKNLFVIKLNDNPIFERNKEILRKHLIINLGQILEINGEKVSEEERKKYGVSIDPKLAKKQEKILRKFSYDSAVNTTSSKFDEIVEKLRESHSGDPMKKGSAEKPKTSYYEQLHQESKRLREQRMKMMEDEFENMKLDFQRRTQEIVNRSRSRREKYKKEWKKKLVEKVDQDVQTIPTSNSMNKEND